MTPQVRATVIRFQRRVVEHYKRLLGQDMTDQDRQAVVQKLAREEGVSSALLMDRVAA